MSLHVCPYLLVIYNLQLIKDIYAWLAVDKQDEFVVYCITENNICL